MKVPWLPSVRVLVAVLADVAAGCSEADAADQVPQRAEERPEHSVNMQRIRTLDCEGAFVCKQGRLLFITGQGKGYCLDLAGDPTSPVVLSDSLPSACDVAVQGNYAFVVANSRMLSVYDMGDGKTWRRIADCSTPAAAENVIVRDRMAPKLAAVFDTPGYATDVIVSDGFAFVADGEGGIRVADVRDPGKPVEVGCFTSKDLNARQLAVLGSLVYVANEPPLRAMILRFEPPLKGDSQGR